MTIRLWKLGSLEHNIFPTKEAILQLRDILSHKQNDGVLELVWGPDIAVEILSTDDVYQPLGVKVEEVEQVVEKINKDIEKTAQENKYLKSENAKLVTHAQELNTLNETMKQTLEEHWQTILDQTKEIKRLKNRGFFDYLFGSK